MQEWEFPRLGEARIQSRAGTHSQEHWAGVRNEKVSSYALEKVETPMKTMRQSREGSKGGNSKAVLTQKLRQCTVCMGVLIHSTGMKAPI